MKKVLWKIVFCISAVLLTSSIYSCSNDDDEDSVGSRELLLGTWNGIHYISQEWENGKQIEDSKEDLVNGTNRYSMEFKEDGTYIEKDKYINSATNIATGTWSYSGNKLTLNEDGDDEEAETWTVSKMTETELAYEQRVKAKGDGTTWEFFEEYSFVR